jgi:hypothetical protein
MITYSQLMAMDAAATAGTWGQFAMRRGPFQEQAAVQYAAHGFEGSFFDTTHDMSAIVDAKPKRLARWTHADDAAFAETLVKLWREGNLTLKEDK